MTSPFTLHFERLGHGPSVLLAFHGIGQTGRECFGHFAAILGDIYTIYAFDLFFHGKSGFPDNLTSLAPLTPNAWGDFLTEFLSSEKIHRFDVAGFSMGGRFALAALETFAGRIDKAFLIAPDGIAVHPLYKIATGFPLARRLFRWTMSNPAGLLKTAELLRDAGVIPKDMARLVRYLLATPDRAEVIYRSWTGFRKLTVDLQSLAAKLRHSGTDVYLIAGQHDKMIRKRDLYPLSRCLPGCHLIMLPARHHDLVMQAAVYFQKNRP